MMIFESNKDFSRSSEWKRRGRKHSSRDEMRNEKLSQTRVTDARRVIFPTENLVFFISLFPLPTADIISAHKKHLEHKRSLSVIAK
jgi:hypothetical protein